MKRHPNGSLTHEHVVTGRQEVLAQPSHLPGLMYVGNFRLNPAEVAKLAAYLNEWLEQQPLPK